MLSATPRPAEQERIYPLLPTLRGLTQPLYALIDAAQDQAILPLLQSCSAPRDCLFEGVHAQTLPAYAAHLVQLTGNDPLLETLVQRGWGRNWGVYLTSAEPFAAVLTHLRQRCWVRDPGGARLYFRYFDPRVMRTAFAAMGESELAAFLGPVSTFLVEAEVADGMRCWHSQDQGVRCYDLKVRR